MKDRKTSIDCAYCGTHLVINLKRVKRMQLNCTACGAPLRLASKKRTSSGPAIHHTRIRDRGARASVPAAGRRSRQPNGRNTGPWGADARTHRYGDDDRRRSRKRKRRGFRPFKLVEDVFDELEDLFD